MAIFQSPANITVSLEPTEMDSVHTHYEYITLIMLTVIVCVAIGWFICVAANYWMHDAQEKVRASMLEAHKADFRRQRMDMEEIREEIREALYRMQDLMIKTTPMTTFAKNAPTIV